MEKRRKRERKKERKQELLFSRERARANRSSGETLRIACCIFRAAQRRAVAFQSTRARRLKSGRFGNTTVLIHCAYSCNRLEKERDACSVPTQPLAVTMPVETDKNVVAAFFFWFCAARSRAPCVYFQRKGHKPHFLRRFPSLLMSKGSMRFRRNEQRQKCPSAPSNATLGADGDVAFVFFLLSVFSQAYLCPRRSTNQDGAEEDRSCPCSRGGHDEGSRTGVLSSYYSSFRQRGGSYLRGRKYLSALFFRIPFRRLLPLFVDLAPRSPSRAKKLAATNSG